MSGDYISAAGGGANIFDTVSKKTPNFGDLGNISMAENSKEKQQAMSSSAQVAGAGIQSLSALTQAANGATAANAAAESKASAAMFGGAMSAIGSLGSAGIGQIGSEGGWKDATDIGFKGNQVNDLGRLRY